jgi:23S rRNA pseudouridine1911/1915/1917 synthase
MVVEIPTELAGSRLDSALAHLLPNHSRTRIRSWIDQGHARIAGRSCRPRDRVLGGERIVLQVPRAPAVQVPAQALDLRVVYEDEFILVLDKPAGLVVHPGAGNPDHTLQNALLAYDARLAELPRAGIVHRLDKDTSGLLVVARVATAHTALVRQLAARSVRREYQAVCVGVLTAGGSVDAPIARHRVDRKRMAVRTGGRPAVTHYRVIARFRAHTHLRVVLETGRTHQIRVHLAHLGHPIVGDPVYGRLRVPRGATSQLIAALRAFKRQALHAERLELEHPATGQRLHWTAPLPDDMQALLDALRADAVRPA